MNFLSVELSGAGKNVPVTAQDPKALRLLVLSIIKGE